MMTAVFLGALQGIVEWLPVSSQGVVAATYALLLDRPLSEAVAYALWLHLGTGLSAIVAFRREVAQLLREAAFLPCAPSPLLSYLVISTLVSGALGVPLLLMLDEISDSVGAGAMTIVGALMLITGVVQLKRRATGTRGQGQVSMKDAGVAGVAQGLAALPGLSRSGLTVAVLLARRLDRRAALSISFLMSIPASIGAAIYAGLTSDVVISLDGLVAGMAAFVVGLLAIHGLLAVAERVNFGAFVLAVGVLILVGAGGQALL